MAEQSTPEHAPRRSGRALRVAALAGAAGLTAFLITSCASGGDDAAKNNPADAKNASVLSASVPDRIVIPDIKVDAPLDTVGLDAKGVMQEPDFAKPKDAAWYKEGPTPGEKGAAAIVGHMDTPQAPEAVFYNLKKLKKDEKIEVHRDDGSTAVFAVDEVDTFKKDQFPTDKVYGDTHGKAELRVITCGGELTKDRHWDANVVVFAHLVGKE
ncbi:class F sortase [Streptomyces sp. NBC_01264]|uniref:class F sortase n=1 Tax=Streptomyces sp. NBC_01264 TaxID=2903804 RepID=UPI0022511470|nr:class F sortase [Streptomyces sp. NBC_01264]MCX4779193.1 class F sortase [Streptomyces sp. NBC_01264]